MRQATGNISLDTGYGGRPAGGEGPQVRLGMAHCNDRNPLLALALSCSLESRDHAKPERGDSRSAEMTGEITGFNEKKSDSFKRRTVPRCYPLWLKPRAELIANLRAPKSNLGAARTR